MTTTATQRSWRDPKGYATAGVCHSLSRLRSPSDLWHSSVSLVTKEELSVSTWQTRDNKATKNRSMIVISLQGEAQKFLLAISRGNSISPLLYELQYRIVVQIGAQQKCLGEETLLSARGRKLLPHAGRAICAQGFPYLGLVHIQPNLLKSCHYTRFVDLLSLHPTARGFILHTLIVY